MRCQCGGASKVIDSRRRPDDVRRRWLCLACGRRWSTLECRAGVPTPAERQLRNAHALIVAAEAELGELLGPLGPPCPLCDRGE